MKLTQLDRRLPWHRATILYTKLRYSGCSSFLISYVGSLVPAWPTVLPPDGQTAQISLFFVMVERLLGDRRTSGVTAPCVAETTRNRRDKARPLRELRSEVSV